MTAPVTDAQKQAAHERDCETCNRVKGLPVLLTRYAIAHKDMSSSPYYAGFKEMGEKNKTIAIQNKLISAMQDPRTTAVLGAARTIPAFAVAPQFLHGSQAPEVNGPFHCTPDAILYDGDEKPSPVGTSDPFIHYTLRRLREGYLYVYHEARQSNPWEAYTISAGGDLTKFDLDTPPDEIPTPTFPCKPETKGCITGCITIPLPDKAKTIWFAVSNNPWTKSVLERNAAEEERAKHMRKFDVAAWLATAQHEHAAPLADVEKYVAEYAPVPENKNPAKKDGEEPTPEEIAQTNRFGFSGAPFSVPKCGGTVWANNLKTRAAEYNQAHPKYVPAILALDDPVGIVTDLASLMEHRETAFSKQDKQQLPIEVAAQISALKKFITDNAIEEYEKNKSKRRASYLAEIKKKHEIKQEDFRRQFGDKAFRSPVFSDALSLEEAMSINEELDFEAEKALRPNNSDEWWETEYHKLGIVTAEGKERESYLKWRDLKYFLSPVSETTQAHAWRQVTRQDNTRDTEVIKTAQIREQDKALRPRYSEEKIVAAREALEEDLTEFRAAHVHSLERTYLAWFQGVALKNVFRCHFDTQDLASGAIYTELVNICIGPTGSRDLCSQAFSKMLTESVTNKDAFIVRASILNQDIQAEHVSVTVKIFEQIQQEAVQLLTKTATMSGGEQEDATAALLINSVGAKGTDALQAGGIFYTTAYRSRLKNEAAREAASAKEQVAKMRAGQPFIAELPVVQQAQNMLKMSESAKMAKSLGLALGDLAEEAAVSAGIAEIKLEDTKNLHADQEKKVAIRKAQIQRIHKVLDATGESISRRAAQLEKTPLAHLRSLLASAHIDRLASGAQKPNFMEFLALHSIQEGKIIIPIQQVKSIADTAEYISQMFSITPSQGEGGLKTLKKVLGREFARTFAQQKGIFNPVRTTLYAHISIEDAPRMLEISEKFRQGARWAKVDNWIAELIAGNLSVEAPTGGELLVHKDLTTIPETRRVPVKGLLSLRANFYSSGMQALLGKIVSHHDGLVAELDGLKARHKTLMHDQIEKIKTTPILEQELRNIGKEINILTSQYGISTQMNTALQSNSEQLAAIAKQEADLAKAIDADVAKILRFDAVAARHAAIRFQSGPGKNLIVGGAASLVTIFSWWGLQSSFKSYMEIHPISKWEDKVFLESLSKLFGSGIAMADAMVTGVNDALFPVARLMSRAAGKNIASGMTNFRYAPCLASKWEYLSKKLLNGRGFAIASYIVAGWDAIKTWNTFFDGDYRLAFAYAGLSALGGAAGYFFWASATSPTGVGLPAAVVFVILGIYSMVLGFFTDNEAQDWLYHCYYGTADGADSKWTLPQAKRSFKQTFHTKDEPDNSVQKQAATT